MSLASDIKKLPERMQCMVKNEIRLVVFKYQMMMWNNPNQMQMQLPVPNSIFHNFQANIPSQDLSMNISSLIGQVKSKVMVQKSSHLNFHHQEH